MKKYFLILVVIFLIVACESEKSKKERLFKESIYESYHLKSKFTKYSERMLLSSSAKKNYVNQKEFINDYNSDYGFLMGRSKNIDTISNRLHRNSSLYYKYLFYETASIKATDSLEKVNYVKIRDSVKKSF